MDAKVLLIENEAKYLDTIPPILEGAGISVFTATHADVGISIAKNVNPSLILLNLATPGTNGLDVCKTLHSIDSLKRTPILLLTLREGSYDPIYESLYGIVGFIKKPFTPESLIEQVSARLGGQPTESSLPEPALMEEALPSHAESNPTDEPEGLENFDDLMSDFEDNAEPDSTDYSKNKISPPSAVMDTTRNISGQEESQTEEFQFDDRSFTDALESEGVAPEDIPDTETAKPLFKKNIKPKTIFTLTSIVLAVGIVVLGAAFMLIGGGDEPKGEPKTSIFESKTVLPKNADVHGIVPNSSITTNTTAASNTPTHETNPTAEINTTAATINTPTVAVEPVKPEIKPEPKPEPKKPETKKEPSPTAEKKASAPSHGFYVQFGAFGSKENAKTLAGELKDQGLKVMVKETVTKTDTKLYRVLYHEPFSSARVAAAKAKSIKDENDIESSTYSE